MNRHSNRKTLSRSNSNNTHYLSKQKITFKTIYKRRNQTICDSQLHEESLSKSSQHKDIYKSQIISPQIRELEKSLIAPPVGIKDYVKKMVNKDQKQLQHKQYNRTFTNEDDDKLSRRSIKSSVSTKLFKKQSASNTSMEIKTIEELQKRIQAMVGETLLRLKKQKSTIGLVKWNQTKDITNFFREIEDMHEIINYFKLQTQENEREKVQDLDKKLKMIEKMIASESIQSDVLKSQYYNWKNQRMNTSSFASKKMLATQSKFNYEGIGSRIQKAGYQEEVVKKEIVSNYNSTNSLNYTKPARKYYVGQEPKKNTFTMNRQPFPRSNYSTQFLNYGNMPIYSYKESHLKQQPECSLAVKASNYQQEYKEKLGLTKNIDFKELDCFKDKFKNTNISFMNSSKKQTAENVKFDEKLNKKKMDSSMKQNMEKLTRIRITQEALLKNLALSKNIPGLKSQNQKQFIWFNKHNKNDQFQVEEPLKSQIKDKRLQKFKETFKNLAMRK